jgi:hypothetical protein
VEGQRPSRTVVPRAVVRADREAYMVAHSPQVDEAPPPDRYHVRIMRVVCHRPEHDENQWPAAEGEGVSSLSRGGHGVRSSPSCEVRRPQGSGSALSKLDCLES